MQSKLDELYNCEKNKSLEMETLIANLVREKKSAEEAMEKAVAAEKNAKSAEEQLSLSKNLEMQLKAHLSVLKSKEETLTMQMHELKEENERKLALVDEENRRKMNEEQKIRCFTVCFLFF